MQRSHLTLIAAVAGFMLFAPHEAHAGPALDERVTQELIQDTICKSGWTEKARKKSWEQRKKRELLRREGYPRSAAGRFQLDHIVPLELGGAATDESNVQLQPMFEARCKDGVEHCLATKVCAGKILLKDAQSEIANDWRQAKKKYCSHTRCRLQLPLEHD